MTPRIVIGLAGLIGAGKSTAADHLVEQHNFRKIKFAGPLKDMMRALGLSEREIEGDMKEQPCDLLGGKTPRFAMQSIGTEWGRQMIAEDLWIRAWRAACGLVPDGIGIVADDVRFKNEAEAVRSLSPFSMIVRVQRQDMDGGNAAHPSELQTFGADHRIANNGSVEDLKASFDALLLAQVRRT